MGGAKAGPTKRISTKTVLIAAGGAVVVAVAIGVTLWLTSGSSPTTPSTTAAGNSTVATSPTPSAASLAGQPSPAAYARLYKLAVIHKTTLTALSKWPKPYEVYHDGTGDQCYEWFDRPSILYNLCFKKGVLADKGLA